VLAAFDLYEPGSVAEASALLARHGEAARVYAGGTELLLAMKEGLLRYEALVNIKAIPGLAGIRFDAATGLLRIGAATPHRAIERDPVVRERFPALAQMEANVANVRVREAGTLGGNLCFAEPHADPGTLLQIYDARVTLERASGSRTVPVEQLFVGPYETCLAGDEILTEVAIPPLPARTAAAYLKFGFLERPSVGVAVAVGLASDRAVVESARIAVGCVGPVPRRMREGESLLAGTAVDETGRRLDEACRVAARASDAVTDLHGSAEYKAHMVEVLIRRAFREALRRMAIRE
jgi:carbon-monoxide dehydrogenase medium subunit